MVPMASIQASSSAAGCMQFLSIHATGRFSNRPSSQPRTIPYATMRLTVFVCLRMKSSFCSKVYFSRSVYFTPILRYIFDMRTRLSIFGTRITQRICLPPGRRSGKEMPLSANTFAAKSSMLKSVMGISLQDSLPERLFRGQCPWQISSGFSPCHLSAALCSVPVPALPAS